MVSEMVWDNPLRFAKSGNCRIIAFPFCMVTNPVPALHDPMPPEPHRRYSFRCRRVRSRPIAADTNPGAPPAQPAPRR